MKDAYSNLRHGPRWIEAPSMTLDLDQSWRRQLAHMPEDAIAKGTMLLREIMKEIPERANLLADAARVRTANRFHGEVTAFARRVSLPWRRIMIANLTYDLTLAMVGCSTAALPTPDGPIVFRNMDFWPEDVLAKTSYLLRYERSGRFAFANAGWCGSSGVVTGLSARGFAVILNAVTCVEKPAWTGYPVLLHIRRAIEDAADFADAVNRLSHQKITTPALLTVVGRENHERVVIERTPRTFAHRRVADDQPLIATNDYRLRQDEAPGTGEIYETACSRYDALCRLTAEIDPNRVPETGEMLAMLTHPDVFSEITAQHIIIHPRREEIRLFVPTVRLASGAGPAA